MDDLPEQLLAVAKQLGADAAEVLQCQSFSQPAIFEANRLKQLETSESEGLSLRLWRNGRPGLVVAYGPVMDPTRLVEKALTLSTLNEPERPELTPGKVRNFPDLGTSVPVTTLIEWGKESIELLRQTYPDILCEGALACELETSRLVTSTGLDYRYRDTTLSADLGAEWIRGDDFLQVWDSVIERSQLNPHCLVSGILQKIAWAENTVEIPQKLVPVVFTAKAAYLLWETVQAALNGKRFLEQSTPWSDLIGTQVAAKNVTILQDPSQGPYSCPFDDEGELTQPLTLIKDGILKQIYCDRKTGRALGQQSTGNGFRPDLGSYPTPSLLNTLIQPGMRSLTEIMADLDDAIIVDQILGGGAGISGELSVNLELGYRLRKGEIICRVKDTMLTGNVYSLLPQILEVANDAIWNESCHTPSILVSGLSITG